MWKSLVAARCQGHKRCTFRAYLEFNITGVAPDYEMNMDMSTPAERHRGEYSLIKPVRSGRNSSAVHEIGLSSG